MKISIAPLSNDPLRDWPIDNYRQLAKMVAKIPGAEVTLLGTRDQRSIINLIAHGLDARVVRNIAGKSTWNEVRQIIAEADVVVCNNSGIAHLSAQMGRPTICIFAASHDPLEWGPRGPGVRLLYTKIACSPCGNSGLKGCRFGQKCMTAITPDIAFQTMKTILEIEPVDVN